MAGTRTGKAAPAPAADRYHISVTAIRMTAAEAVLKVKGVSSLSEGTPERAIRIRKRSGTLQFEIHVDAFYGTDLVRLSAYIQTAVRKAVEQYCCESVSMVSVAVERVMPAPVVVSRKRK